MWTYRNPVRIHFGTGSREGISALIADRVYALITYDEPIFGDLAARIEKFAGPATVIINNVTPNPNFEDLSLSCHQLVASKTAPEVIVALGGGSVLDAAKVVAVGGKGFEAVRSHLESSGASGSLPDRAVPIIAVPTTSGTGSEVTSWATIWDTEAAKKYSLARDDLYPTDAVVDPALMLGMPRFLTISTGLDALSHALESLWNVNANPVSAQFAVAAARDVLAHLGPLAENLGDLEGRTRMARAATMAGLAFSNTRTALAHSLSYPITLHHGVPHGIACSFSLPDVMRSAIGADPECDNALRKIFGPHLEAGADNLAAFIDGLGVSTNHADHGVSGTEWSAWIEDAIDGDRGRNFIGGRDNVQKTLVRSAVHAGAQPLN